MKLVLLQTCSVKLQKIFVDMVQIIFCIAETVTLCQISLFCNDNISRSNHLLYNDSCCGHFAIVKGKYMAKIM